LIPNDPYSLQEKLEEEKWSQGSKSNKSKEEKEEKRKTELARKQELARILAEEEASLPPKPKPTPKAGAKKAAASSKKVPAGPGALAAGGLKGNLISTVFLLGTKLRESNNRYEQCGGHRWRGRATTRVILRYRNRRCAGADGSRHC
jgi:hypothetical protein